MLAKRRESNGKIVSNELYGEVAGDCIVLYDLRMLFNNCTCIMKWGKCLYIYNVCVTFSNFGKDYRDWNNSETAISPIRPSCVKYSILARVLESYTLLLENRTIYIAY